jgi:hypothetical protein
MLNRFVSMTLRVLGGLSIAAAVHAQQAASAPAIADEAPTKEAVPAPAPAGLHGRRGVAALAVALEPVTLAPNAKVDPELEADCKFEEIVRADVAKRLHHARLGGTKPTGADARVLRVAVTDVSGAAGGVYTGTKSIRIHATLLVDGKVERETDVYRYNVGGNPFRGTCHIFRQHTKRLGKDLVSWIKDEGYRVEDKPMGEDDDAE